MTKRRGIAGLQGGFGNFYQRNSIAMDDGRMMGTVPIRGMGDRSRGETGQAAPGWATSILGRGGVWSCPRPPICAAPTIDPAKAAGARGCGERSALPSAALQRFCDASQFPRKPLFSYLTRAKPGARVAVRAGSMDAGSTIASRGSRARSAIARRSFPAVVCAGDWQRGLPRRGVSDLECGITPCAHGC